MCTLLLLLWRLSTLLLLGQEIDSDMPHLPVSQRGGAGVPAPVSHGLVRHRIRVMMPLPNVLRVV